MTDQPVILLVDDERSIRDTFAPALRRLGYEVRTASDGISALEALADESIALVILDIDLPHKSGGQVLRQLRADGNRVPVLVLSKHGDTEERAATLRTGADDYMNKPPPLSTAGVNDYLPKPFGLNELVARMDKLLARRGPSEAGGGLQAARRLAAGELLLDRASRRAYLGPNELGLASKAYDLLEYMMLHTGVLLTREVLLAQVWGWDYVGGTRTVDTHVRRLRQALRDDAAQPTYVETVRSHGYRFVSAVEPRP